MVKVLSLDLSSHCGWAVLEDDHILTYGKIDIPCKDNSFPFGISAWAKSTAETIFELIDANPTDKVLIERSNSSKFRNSQNYLDFMHAYLIDILLDEGYSNKVIYIDSSHWRKVIGMKLNDAQKKQNKLAKQANKNKTILRVDGKRVGKITKKHLSVYYVNNKYNLSLKLKDNDIADCLSLASSYFIENK